MSGPTRQRSLRERLHGIGIPWQGKKSKSYYNKDGQTLVESEEKKPSFMDSRSCDPILPCDDKTAVPSSTETDPAAVGAAATRPDESALDDSTTTTSSPPPPKTPPIQTDESNQAKFDEKSAEQNKEETSKLAEKKLLSRSFTQPKGTEEYQVKVSDTLSSIAAKFHTTPSELAKLNRLTMRMIFPGQLLFVPERRLSDAQSETREDEDFENGSSLKQESGDGRTCDGSPKDWSSSSNFTRNGSRIASRLEDGLVAEGDPSSLPRRKVSVTDALRIPYRRHSDRMQRFLKVKARHFTDGQGVVSGVLIVTPNAVMFDPNVSDPLVIEHGIESYGVIAPLTMVMKAAIYFDIAHMKVKNAPETPINIPKPDIYYGKMSDDNVAVSDKQSKPSDGGKDRIPDSEAKSHEQHGRKASLSSSSVKPDDDDNDDDATKKLDVPSRNVAKAAGEEDKEETAKLEAEEVEPIKDEVASDVRRDSLFWDGSLDKEVSDAFADGIKKPSSGSSSGVPSPTPPPRASSSQQKSEPQEKQESGSSRKEKMLKRLSYPMESITSYTHSSISRLLSSSPKSFVDFSGGLFVKNIDESKEDGGPTTTSNEPKDIKTSSVGSEKSVDESTETNEDAKQPDPVTKSESSSKPPEFAETTGPTPPPTVGYKNLVEEKPEVFAVLDKLLSQHSGREQEGPPLYLCLRMGHPKEKKSIVSTPILSYGKKRAKSEYWFGIPHNRVEDTYNFLQQWFPHLYGDVDDANPDELGFVPIDEDAEEEEDEEEEAKKEEDQEKTENEDQGSSTHLSFLKLVEDHFGIRSISPTDWEVLSMTDSEKLSFVDYELPLPELLSTSEIFQEDHVKELYSLLPARAIGYPWTLIFSTSLHGFNLKTLYRKMMSFDTPVLLSIADIQGCVFGSLISSPLRQSDHFYGNGESFLYTFYPEFKVYKWTGENMYFVKGDPDSIAIGAGDGHFGIWIDGDLNHGRSQKCLTFDNEILNKTGDFVIKALEVWGFV